MKDKYLVFYAGLLYGEYTLAEMRELNLPDGAYYRTPGSAGSWLHVVGIPIRIPQEEVPKELLTLVLLLS